MRRATPRSAARVPLAPGRLLFHPHLAYLAAPAGSCPALVGVFSNFGDPARAVECTFLAEDGSRLAKVDHPKLYFGTHDGYVLPLSHGATGSPLSESREPQPVILTQTVETGLRVMRERPEARVWVVLNLRNASRLPFDMPQISNVSFVFEKGLSTDEQAAVRALILRTGKPFAVWSAAAFLRSCQPAEV
ncbi:DUF7146 domain-containing protein [Methylocella tundrae]|uniref:DUF7146 domain-containing protein n=1 Tax=Methylocella tundrae TaxID=227605 RepID=A0A4U8YUU2_METTU|nr:hypothetical protein [Methylocella tundrae]WPP04779.1 hypothetical protein SIN04_02800 [Methylocella tundrae]VFU06995.1 protein of unknown function [Methylocella tundrae]